MRRPLLAAFRHCFFTANALLLILCLAQHAKASQKGDFSRPITFYAEQHELSTVLMSFARTQELNGSVSAAVSGTISGRFVDVDPNVFLDGLRSAFGVAWYRIGSTLYFYSENEMTQAHISPGVVPPHELAAMLQRSALLSPQLPPVVDSAGGMLVIKGPAGYISQVQTAAAAFEQSRATRFVMRVFPLKYAWADDMTVNSMDKSVTVPGVASILRAMVSGSATSPSSVVQQPATVPKLLGTGLIAQGRESEQTQTAAPAASPPGATSAALSTNIMPDSRVNSVIIQDAEYRMPYYAKVIADLDKPVELVEIHAAIVDIDTNFKRDLGITYQYSSGYGSGWKGGGELSSSSDGFSPQPGMGFPSGPGLSLSTIYTKGIDYFLARVQALEEDGEARMLGRPSVLTVDNIQATLENTSTYYLEISGYQAVDLFKVEAGTVLRVTPHIIYGEDGKKSVKLAVNVQDDQNDNVYANSPGSGVLPPIKQTRIDTQAIIGAGQSLLIGGYYYEQSASTDSGIPILMHIPVIGHLFKTASKNTKRMERLILITPRVVSLDEMPQTPSHIDNPAFQRSPTQDHYGQRELVQPSGSGCARHARGGGKTSASGGSGGGR